MLAWLNDWWKNYFMGWSKWLNDYFVDWIMKEWFSVDWIIEQYACLLDWMIDWCIDWLIDWCERVGQWGWMTECCKGFLARPSLVIRHKNASVVFIADWSNAIRMCIQF